MGMSEFEYYTELDSHPFTGEARVSFRAKISEETFLDKYFDGTPGCDRVENVTRGKVYDIHKVAGYGDMADFYFLDDTGKEKRLADFFFEEAGEQPLHRSIPRQQEG